MRYIALAAALTLPLFGQAPDAAFFKGDPRTIMVACAEKARSMESKDSQLLTEIGRVYLAAGNRAKAEEAFKAAIALDVKDGSTYWLIAQHWLAAGQKAEAMSACRQLLERDPKSPRTIMKAAQAFMNLGLAEEAVELMAHLCKVYPKPSDQDFAVDFAKACLRNRRFDLASAWLDRAYQADPKDWKNCAQLTKAALEADQLELATRFAQRTLEAAPKDWCAWNEIALAFADYVARHEAKR